MGSSGDAWKLKDYPKGKTVAVIVLDGWGEAKPNEFNAISVADTPVMDSLKKGAPEKWRLIKAHGNAAEDDMGNSDNAVGAGRIFAQGQGFHIRQLQPRSPADVIFLCVH